MSAPFEFGPFAVGALLAGRAMLACAAMRRIRFVGPADPQTGGASVTIAVLDVDGCDPSALRQDVARQTGCEVALVVADTASPADGWLPWNAALQRVAAMIDSRHEWVLLAEHPFHLLRDDAVARIVATARGQRAAVLWLVPRLEGGIFAPSLLTALADALPAMAAVNRDRESIPWPGAACLMRRELLDRVLTDPRAPLAPVIDTVLLAVALDADRRARYVFACDEVGTDRPRSARLGEALERLLAMLGFRGSVVVVGLAAYGLLFGIAIDGAARGTPWGLWAGAGLACLAVPCVMIAQTVRVQPLAGLFAPFVFPLEAIATLVVIARARWRGGVAWRGRFFTLAQLREGAEPTAD